MLARMKSYREASGFTILEILVVVAVISVIASTIILNTNFKRPDNEIKQHASRLSQSIKLLLQEAILDDRNFALSLQPKVFLILEYNGQEWLPSEDTFLKQLPQEHEYQDQVIVDNALVPIEKTDKPKPHILILSSGEISVFEWQIEDPDNGLKMKLTSNMLGDILVEGPVEVL